MVDKIKPLKLEDTTSGSSINFTPTEADPTQDYVAAKGIAFENSNDRTIDLSGSGHIQFKDAIETVAVSVRQLRTAINNLFDNTSNSFTATDVQEAIEEARDTSTAKARISPCFGFDGTASATRWLEVVPNVASNVTGFPMPRAGTIREISIATGSNATCTATVYKNGSSQTTISLSASQTNSSTGLNISLAALDVLSVAVTSGSVSKPIVVLFVELD